MTHTFERWEDNMRHPGSIDMATAIVCMFSDWRADREALIRQRDEARKTAIIVDGLALEAIEADRATLKRQRDALLAALKGYMTAAVRFTYGWTVYVKDTAWQAAQDAVKQAEATRAQD